MNRKSVAKKVLSFALALALCIPVFLVNGLEAKAYAVRKDGLALEVDIDSERDRRYSINLSTVDENGELHAYEGKYEMKLTTDQGSWTMQLDHESVIWIRADFGALGMKGEGLVAMATLENGASISLEIDPIPGGEDEPEPTVSSNVPSKPENTTGSNGSEAAPVVEHADKVTTGGKEVVSTLGGVYIAKSVNGAAVLTAKADVAAAAGLSAEVVQRGDNVSFYVCDSRNKAAKAALSDAAAAINKKVAAYVNADLYAITKKGTITKIETTTSPVKVVFGLPGYVVKAGTPVSIICITSDGKTITMEDTDTDARTITVDANVFGVYAIVY